MSIIRSKIKRIARAAIGGINRLSEDLSFDDPGFRERINRGRYKAKAEEQEDLGNYFQAASFYATAHMSAKRDHCLYKYDPEVYPPVYFNDVLGDFTNKPKGELDKFLDSDNIIRL